MATTASKTSVDPAALITLRDSLVDYLLNKVRAEDWHAVQDAASDIREIEAKLQILSQVRAGV